MEMFLNIQSRTISKKMKLGVIIQKYIADGYNIKIYGQFPSITVIKKQ